MRGAVNGLFSAHATLKMLAINKLLLRFFPCRAKKILVYPLTINFRTGLFWHGNSIYFAWLMTMQGQSIITTTNKINAIYLFPTFLCNAGFPLRRFATLDIFRVPM